MKCAACGKNVRQTRRALLVVGPGKTKPGRVCSPCAATGILIVFGGDDRPRKRTKPPRAPARGRILDAPTTDLGPGVPPAGERCEARTDKTRRRCTLPRGHGGSHRSMLGQAWNEVPSQ